MPSSSKSAKRLIAKFDLNSPATAEAFREAARAYTERATRSKKSAVSTLQREGILNKSGRLAKRYSEV